MKKLARTLSVLTLAAFLGLPALSAAELQATVIRDQVIGDSLNAAYTEESGAEQTVMVFIGDIDHETVQANRPEPATTLNLAVAEEYENQAEIEAVQADIMARRAASRAAYLAQNTAFANRYLDGNVEYISKYSPMIIATLDSVETNQLALNSEVEEIELYEMEMVEEDYAENEVIAPYADVNATSSEYTDYLSMINADIAHQAYTGRGIKIGMLDTGVPFDTYHEQLGITTNEQLIYPSDRPLIGCISSHGTVVALTYKSVAPDATLYCSAKYPTCEEEIEILLDRGVNVINMSLGPYATEEDRYGKYTTFAKWIDHISDEHLVSFVISAGNHSNRDSANVNYINSCANAHNAITVGAVDSTGNISSFSRYSSMLSVYPTKPDICAPGENLNIPDFEGTDGTSVASPQVAGAIALMFEQDSQLMYNPEAVKAVLAVCVNNEYIHCVTSPMSTSNPYQMYGAGVLDCSAIISALNSENYYIDYFPESSVGTTYSTTANLTAGDITRVALCYMKTTSISANDHVSATDSHIIQETLPNLILKVYQGTNFVGQATYTYGNLKILEFTPEVTGEYTFVVETRMEIPVIKYYAIAWIQINN